MLEVAGISLPISLLCLIAIGLFFLVSLVFFLVIVRRTNSQKIMDEFMQKQEERVRISDKLYQDGLSQLQQNVVERLHAQALQQQQDWHQFKEEMVASFNQYRQQLDKRQLDSTQSLQANLQKGLQFMSDLIGQRVDKLTQETGLHLKDISGQVDKRLNEGFAKTTETFTDVIKRLALIDEAQKKITELSGNVVSLQEILADKRSRGAFGEIQLAGLLRNMLPENSFSLQHVLTNGNRVDCMLFLPAPTGNVAIDAKFPLESYKQMTNIQLSEIERQTAEKQFYQDVKKHIQDIASKYIISGETADGAVMFIPAEAIFAEIHAHHPALVELAQQSRVWLVSPTTLMAILTTARAVIKDEATQKQVVVIREHLRYLAQDFDRFQVRMNQLAKHIEQAHQDVEQVHTSARKISSRFSKIESVEFEKLSTEAMSLLEKETE